jgi:RNA polymerase sigma-70 factor (ECF subfamily)
LNQLPAEQRLTLELAYQMGHSLEEIAAITQCPVGTVKARMFHAREKLRLYLPNLGGTSGGIPGGTPGSSAGNE